MKRDKALVCLFLIGILGGILMVILFCFGEKGWATAVLIVCVVLSLGLKSQTGCRHCGYIPRRDGHEYTHCPKCGKPYEEE